MFARLYRPVFYVGVGALLLAVLLGVFEAWRSEGRPPGLSFSNLDEIEALLLDGRNDEAIGRLEMTLKLVTRNRHLAHNMLGRALQAEKRYHEAADHYREAVALQPEFVEGHNNLGVVLARDQEWVPAITAFRQAIRVDPGFEPAFRNLSLAAAAYERSPAGGASAITPDDRALLAEARALIASGPGAPGSPAPAAELARGRERVAEFYAARLEDLYGQFSQEFAGRMGLSRLSTFQQRVVDQLGRETELLREQVGAAGAGSYSRWARFERFDGIVELTFVFAEDGEVQDFRIRLGDTEG